MVGVWGRVKIEVGSVVGGWMEATIEAGGWLVVGWESGGGGGRKLGWSIYKFVKRNDIFLCLFSSLFFFRVYVPCIYVLNKIDQISIQVITFLIIVTRYYSRLTLHLRALNVLHSYGFNPHGHRRVTEAKFRRIT